MFVFRNLFFNFCFSLPNPLVEVSIYDAWSKNIETEWLELSKRQSEESIIAQLQYGIPYIETL